MEKDQVIDSKYKIESALGGGSFSEVFVVQDLRGLAHRSALKLLRRALSEEASEEAVSDFKHEFAILKDLNHPNICRILDFGFDPGLKQYYYTTELVKGRDLFEATAGKSVDEILELFVQTLRAFHYLHSYQVYHFDVKAANVLVTESGDPSIASQIKVIDFGLASIDPGGKMIGTPAYMAPEIIAKERPDGRSDLYSIGILFYACFTRQNPLRGKSVPETLKKQQTLIPPPASVLREDLPSYLDRILAKLLEKNPANRYQRAEEVLREINFYSPKKFAMETRETLLSYLPEEGRLIGRRKQGEVFTRACERLFSPASPDTLGFLMILGERGTGKSRLLKDFKYEAQLKGLAVESASVKNPEEIRSWLETFRKQATEGRPTVFLLDDLDHWREGDEGFQQFRGALARLVFGDPTDRLPVLWVGTATLQESVPTSLWEILPKKALEALDVGPFTPTELREYVASLTGLEDPPAELLKGLESRTNGNPLLVTEILHSLIETGGLFDSAGRWKETTFEDMGIDFSKARFSGVLEELLSDRYEKLPADLQRALEVLAVAGRLKSGELSRMPDFEDPTPLLERLLTRDLVLRDENGRYQIKNTTLGDLIAKKLPEGRRRALHDAAAELHAEGSERRLYHEIRGSDLKRAFTLCRQAAERCLQEARGREAAELFRFALDLQTVRPLDQDIELRLKLGEACLISLEYPAALEALEKVEKILSEMKDRVENVHLPVDALLRIGAVYLKVGEIEKSRGSLSAALALLHYLKGDRVRELVAENLRGAILVQEGKLNEARELLEKTRNRWETELSNEERARVTNNDLGVVSLMAQQYPQALQQLNQDLEAYQALGDRLLLARTHYHLGQAYLGLKEFSAAVEHYQLSANLAQALKNTELLLRAYNGLGNTFNLMGKSDEAVRYYERGLDLCERTGDLRSHSAILVNIGIIESAQGGFDLALRHLEPAVAFLKSLKNRFAIDRQVLVRALLEEGDLFLKQKEWKPSEEALREALRIVEEGEGAQSLRFWVLYTLGGLFRAKGDEKELRKLLPEIRKSASSPEEIEKLTVFGSLAADAGSVHDPAGVPAASKPPDFYARLLDIHKDVNAGVDLSLVFKKVMHFAIELAESEEGAIQKPEASVHQKITEMSAKLEHLENLIQASSRRETKYNYDAIIARSEPMFEIFRLLDKITETDLAVFLHGESGTGKELIARALHDNSTRSKKRFVAVNCGALPAHLMESELFGYKAGAFTGAVKDKKGLFEEADGGTLFLDEVAELDPSLQAKLLRVVQEGEFYRLGDNRPIRSDVRIVSASNKDIEELVTRDKFREDLYYRLCQIRLDLPPLRERREDIPLLIDAFIRQESGKPLKISSRLLKAMVEYDWPGNIRELENLIKVAVALADGEVIDTPAIPSNYGLAKHLFTRTGRAGSSLKSGRDPALSPTPLIDSKNKYDPRKSWYDYEKLILAKAYRLNGFKAGETAEMLGIAPATVYKKIREIGLMHKHHPLYAEDFHYQKGRTLKDYLKPIFQAALAHAGDKPYTAIGLLKVSQGYFYKVMKEKN